MCGRMGQESFSASMSQATQRAGMAGMACGNAILFLGFTHHPLHPPTQTPVLPQPPNAMPEMEGERCPMERRDEPAGTQTRTCVCKV